MKTESIKKMLMIILETNMPESYREYAFELLLKVVDKSELDNTKG